MPFFLLRRGIWNVCSQGCEIVLCKDVSIFRFTSQLFNFMLSKKSIQSTDETLSCAKYSQRDCFGDWKPESQVLSLLHSSRSMDMDSGTGGWEVSRSNAREDMTQIQPASDFLSQEGWSGIWGALHGHKNRAVQINLLLCLTSSCPFCHSPERGPKAELLSCTTLDFLNPEGPAAAQLHNDIFS